MSRDNLDSLRSDNVCSGPMAPELRVVPTGLETVAAICSARRRRGSRCQRTSALSASLMPSDTPTPSGSVFSADSDSFSE